MFDFEEHYIEVPDNWQTAWLDRELLPLTWYLQAVSLALALVIIVLGLLSIRTKRRAVAGLNEEPSRRIEIIARREKRLLQFTRGYFFVAMGYIVHTVALYLADTVICIKFLSKDVASQPEAYTKDRVVDMALFCIWLLVVFMTAFFFVPLVQMVLVTKLLRRFSKKHGSEILSDFVPEATWIGTHIALVWCVVSFSLTALWSPTSDSCFWRGIALQAAWGSSLAWLQISCALNFCADRLEDIKLSSDQAMEILRMFHKSATAVYWPSEKSLPQYEGEPQQRPLLSDKR